MHNNVVRDSQNVKNHQQPEDPRPTRSKIFKALTRKQHKQIKHQKQNLDQLLEENRLIPCRLDDGECGDYLKTQTSSSSIWQYFRGRSSSSGGGSSAASNENAVLVYNPLPEPRYLCGTKILGGGVIEITKRLASEFSKCQGGLLSSPGYVFSPYPPPLSPDKGEMDPIELYWNPMIAEEEYEESWYYDSAEEKAALMTEKFKPCGVPCRTNGEFAILSTINIRNTKWEITMTMEGQEYYADAHYRKKNYQQDKYYALTSFKSEIPVPYFSWAEYKINNPPINFQKAIKGASFLANNCDSMSHREDWVKGLIEDTDLRVDSLSSCFHNAEIPPGLRNLDNKTHVLEQYLFHLAFENQRSDDYITEKMWGTLAAGTLPVYLGAPNIKSHVPPNSVIFADDYNSPKELADYLMLLTKDKALYESYHTWRSQPINPTFLEKYAFTDTHSTCRMCKWAYAKKHGLEWDHPKQEIEQPFIVHQTCRNKHGLIGHPFKEYWLEADGGKSTPVKSAGDIKTCILDDKNRAIVVGEDGRRFQRKVYDQDGVTDLVIDEIPSTITDYEEQGRAGRTFVLRLEAPILSNELKEKSSQEWWLQDNQSRMTLLVSEGVAVSNPDDEQGTIQFLVTQSMRIRVIMENVDTFHKHAASRENYFGELMKEDFLNPLLAYKVQK